MALPTTADFVADALDVDKTTTSNLLLQAPFLAQLPEGESSDGGTTHKYSVYTGAPISGYRAQNDGIVMTTSSDTITSVDLEILDFTTETDVAVANRWRDGGAPAWNAREMNRHFQEAMFKAEGQIFYGTGAGGDAAGPTGFVQSTFLDGVAKYGVVDAGGALVGAQTSVYLVRQGFDDVRFITSGEIETGETHVVQAIGSTGPYAAYFTPGIMWTANQIGGKYSVVRIANLDTVATLTDDLISDALSLFKAGQGPSVIVGNRQSLKQLQQSRTATNGTGAPAPFPSESFGVPWITVDSLINTEAVLA